MTANYNGNMINSNNNPNSYFSNYFSKPISNYGQTLDGYKELMNQNILAITPESWHPFLSSILPAHWQEWLLPLMGGPFFLLFLAEWFYQSKRGNSQTFNWRRAATNFSLGGSYLSFELIIQALVVLPICLWLYQYRLFTIEVTAVTALPIFIAVEFCYYWFHRSSHRVNWFWSAHVVHHSDDQMNLSTAMRQSLLTPAVKSVQLNLGDFNYAAWR